MKKSLFLLLATLMLLTCLPLAGLTVTADIGDREVIASGTTGSCSWKVTGVRVAQAGFDDCVLTISGNGAMADYDNPNETPWVWNAIREPIDKLVIENGVTKIGAHAFAGTDKLSQEITLPGSVKIIGEQAFAHSALTSVTIPSGVTKIGLDAFWGCEALTTVNYNAVNASCVETPSGGDTTDIISRPFNESGVKTVTIGNGVKIIPTGLLYECTALTKVTIPNSVTTIGDSAFYGCSSLTTVTIPDSVTKIERYAFENSGLAAITIPKNVKEIGVCAFQSCKSLKTVNFNAIECSVVQNNYYELPVFDDCTATTVTVGNGVQRIPSHLFRGCGSLVTVTIPESVTSIGQFSFNGCGQLKDVYYGGSKSQWEELYSPYSYNKPLENATIHYGKEDPSTTGGNSGNTTPAKQSTTKKPPVGGTTPGKTSQTVNVPGGTTTSGNATTTTTTAPEKLVVLVQTDSATVEAVSDTFPKEAVVKLENVAADALSASAKNALDELAQKFVAYEITATANGAAVQPNGKVKVTFAIPTEYNLDRVAVLYVSPDGETEVIPSVVENGKIIAELSHFSTYVLAELGEAAASTTTTVTTTTTTAGADADTETPDDDATPGGFPWAIVIALAVVVLAGGVAAWYFLIFRKK